MKSALLTKTYDVEGLDFQVTGYIHSDDSLPDLPFRWSISHYCKATESAATAYRPSRIYAATLEEAEILLDNYGNSFTNIGVVPASP